MRDVINKAIALHRADVGDLGCIGDYSCECFACLLRSFAIDIQRKQSAIESEFVNSMIQVRDSFEPITSGSIERAKCVGRAEAYGGKRGYRKTMLKDAVSIARSAVATINRAIKEFEDESTN